jgi:predicted nuclease with RNAse H fold
MPTTYDGKLVRSQPVPSEPTVACGIDVGGDRLHIVGLSAEGAIVSALVIDPADADGVKDWFASLPPKIPIAIDGPEAPSSAPFRDDETVSRKFKTARGCEVELGRQRGIWVSFVTPMERGQCAAWMTISMDLHDTANDLGHTALETYPYAVFHTLNRGRPPKKSTSEGAQTRARLLRDNGISMAALNMWSHDGLDAAAAALVAWQNTRGVAESVGDSRDNSKMWLPATATS